VTIKSWRNIVAIVAIIAIAAFAGNMINIGMSYASYWQSIDPIAFMEDFKVKFPLLLPPTAATLLPALIATMLSVVFNWKNPETRSFWLIALLGLLLTIAITLIYHLPTNFAFMVWNIVPPRQPVNCKLGCYCIGCEWWWRSPPQYLQF
jgi:hypothetical protein